MIKIDHTNMSGNNSALNMINAIFGQQHVFSTAKTLQRQDQTRPKLFLKLERNKINISKPNIT